MDGAYIRLVLCVSVLSLAGACFLLGTVALILPNWANFRNRVREERGTFGPWTVCRDMGYGKTSCGNYVSSFKPIFGVYAGGICSAIAVVSIGILCLASALQLLIQCYRSSILVSHFTLATIKLINGVVGALLTLVGVCLFATQPDDLERGIIVEWSFCFYLEVILATFAAILLLLTLMEYLISRRLPPAPMELYMGRKREAPGRNGLMGTTISNPGFQDDQQAQRHRLTTNGISMTDSSVRFVLTPSSIPNPALTRLELARELSKRAQRRSGPPPYTPTSAKAKTLKSPTKPSKSTQRSSTVNNESQSNLSQWNNGSVRSTSPTSNGSSISTFSTLSTAASLSSNPRGPLRSSLKKSHTTVEEGFGIQNPGFSGTSPTLSRTGSLKKVRIQTQSTEV